MFFSSQKYFSLLYFWGETKQISRKKSNIIHLWLTLAWKKEVVDIKGEIKEKVKWP